MAARRTAPLLAALALALGRPGCGLLIDGTSLDQLDNQGPGGIDIQDLGAPLELELPAVPVRDHVGAEGYPLKKADVPGAGALASHEGEGGGPWLKTRKGEDFHVMRSGLFNFLTIPRNANKANQKFSMLGHITPLKRSDPCGSGALLTGLHMNGSWLGSFGSITFTAEGALFDTPDSIGIKIEGGINVSVDNLQEYVGVAGYPLKKVARKHPRRPVGKAHGDTLVVAFEFETMEIRVGWAHSANPVANWLWVDVSSFANVAEPVGGLLGEDSHKEIEAKDNKCKGDARPKKSTIFSSNPPTSPTDLLDN